jgi:translation initiation factor 2B subunit (eIF-2B alpha/beta/delta family)
MIAIAKVMRPNNNFLNDEDYAALEDLANHVEEYVQADVVLLDLIRRFVDKMKVARRDLDEWEDMWNQFDEVNDEILEKAKVSNRQYE